MNLKQFLPFILILFFIGIKCVIIDAQTIDDTEWIACNIYEDTTFLKFANDSIYFKSPEVEGFEDFLPVSVYSISGDTLFWNDLEAPEQCEPAITGTYIYKISSDSLTFSPLEDNCYFRLEVLEELILKRIHTTGISIIFKEQIKIYPNPFKDFIQLEMDSNAYQNYEIITSSGVVFSSGVLSFDNKITTDEIPSGFYFLKLFASNNSKTPVHKIIKY